MPSPPVGLLDGLSMGNSAVFDILEDVCALGCCVCASFVP